MACCIEPHDLPAAIDDLGGTPCVQVGRRIGDLIALWSSTESLSELCEIGDRVIESDRAAAVGAID